MGDLDESTLGGRSAVDDGGDRADWARPMRSIYLIGLIDRGLQRELQQRVAPHGLSVSEFSALSALRSAPGLSNAELARRSLVTPQSMSEVIAGLERRGLVARTQHPDHGRILMTTLTDEGGAVFESARPAVVQLEQELLADLDVDELAELRAALLKILQRLRDR